MSFGIFAVRCSLYVMDNFLYISVILPLKLDWEPCYSIPDGMDDFSVSIGDRVKVRFANRIYTGVVSAVGVVPETSLSRILPVISVVTDMMRILPQEIELWRQVAEYYMCSVGEVYKAAYPYGKLAMEEERAAALKRMVERKAKVLQSMREKVLRIRNRLERKEELLNRAKEGTKARMKYLDEAEKIRKELLVAEQVLLVAESSKENQVSLLPESMLRLSQSQEKAYDEIKEAFNTGKPVLLHGVTGSGKTEIYIRLARETLSRGRNVLYLVPEIALSRQLEERLELHFHKMLMTFHSGESPASRRNTAESIRTCRDSGRNYIVLGTRSSLFLPHHDVGLVIVDEEHDSSYKQDSPAPRYNGRDTALMMSRIHEANVILGSATPSLEEIYNCMTGKHQLVALHERYHGAEESDVEIIDTKAERRKRGMTGCFSIKLIEHIRDTLVSGGQVMILRSRRAWASAMQCEECGEILKCPHCNVSLSLHKTAGSYNMICHSCGYRSEYVETCRKCNGRMRSVGAGTQKLEEELSQLFPEAVVARLDSDSAQNKSHENAVIKGFAKGEINILVGTQIVTKGFDFSNLKLVAVIAADTLLGIQDFRADEKAIQLLEQFRGRCGRRGAKGIIVIQTSQPEHPVYQNILSGTSSEYQRILLKERQDFGFPPFTRILEIIVRDMYEDRLERMASGLSQTLENCFRNLCGDSLSNSLITGPYSPVVDKIADQHIKVIRVNLKKDRNLPMYKKAVKEVLERFCKERKYDGHVTVNVDPAKGL